MKSLFEILNKMNVSEHVEKKGNFSYLSWPYAVEQLRLADPSATWKVEHFDGKPYMQTDAGIFVEVSVTVAGITLSQVHPVLDIRNKPISSPTSYDINTSIMRCLVKAIALHGLGLYIYKGEDLPEGTKVETISDEQLAHIKTVALENGADLERLRNYFKVERLSDIPASEFDRVIRSLQKNRKAA